MKKLLLLLAFSVALFTGCSGKKDSQEFHIGFQLYSVRQDLARDFYGTLKKVSDMGFEGVEFFNEYSDNTPAQVRQMCDELGLVIFSNHVPFADMMSDIDKVIEESRILGVEYITFPYMDVPSRPGVNPDRFKETVKAIGEIGAKVKAAGFQLLYHNHDFEFAKLPDGTVGHDYIFSSNSPENVQVELDVCWADYAGFKVDEIVRKYAGRIPVLHMKDYYQEGKLDSDPYALIGTENQGGGNRSGGRGRFEFRPLGKGVMDFAPIIEAARASGVKWMCVEQDDPSAGARDRFEGPEISIQFLRDNLPAK